MQLAAVTGTKSFLVFVLFIVVIQLYEKCFLDCDFFFSAFFCLERLPRAIGPIYGPVEITMSTSDGQTTLTFTYMHKRPGPVQLYG